MHGILVSVLLLTWPLIVLGMFARMVPRKAVTWAFVLAWLFLPWASLKMEGLPAYTKMSATCYGVVLAILTFDARRLLTFRSGWIDLPMVIWCLCPLASSLSNSLGWHDGASGMLGQIVSWGLPYFIGRLYFRTWGEIRELAIAFFIGGLVYVPLCLIEVRMSPQLHTWVYGYFQSTFAQTYRMGGWRPTVFMGHGLMVGMWMCMTGLVGIWLWQGRALPRTIGQSPLAWTLVPLLVTAVLCKSTGALMLIAAGLAALYACSLLRTKALLWLLVLLPVAYIAVRGGGIWDGGQLVSISGDLFGGERGDSMKTRVRAETLLAEKAMQQPSFGWGRWGRNRVNDEGGYDIAITDGMWIIFMGVNGLVGLSAWVALMLLPPAIVLWRIRPGLYATPEYAAPVALAVVSILFFIDCLPNAMFNPVYLLSCGALASVGRQRVGISLVRTSRRTATTHAMVPLKPEIGCE